MKNNIYAPSSHFARRRQFAAVCLVILFCFSFILCAFSPFSVTYRASASAPESITIQTDETEGVMRLTWLTVDGATGYLVYLNGSKITPSRILDAQLNISPLVVSSGFYAFTVQAYSDSGIIATGSYTLDRRARLAQPQRIRVENGTLAWDSVDNAVGYRISVNGYAVYVGTANELAIDEICADDADYSISLCALGNGSTYIDSSPTVFTYAAEHPLDAPQNVNLAIYSGNLALSWTPAPNATDYYYEVYLSSTLVKSDNTTATLVDLWALPADGTYLVKVRQNGKKSALCEFLCKKYVINGGILNEIEL